MSKLSCSLIWMLVLLISNVAEAQKKCSKVGLHGFERTTLPGMVPGGVIDEQGREVERKSSVRSARYYYLEFPSRFQVSNIRVWLSGVSYDAIAKQVLTPVVIAKTPVGNRERSDTLISKSRNSVLQISLGKENTAKAQGKILEAINRSELVVEYTMKQKLYFVELKQIKKLEPLALQ